MKSTDRKEEEKIDVWRVESSVKLRAGSRGSESECRLDFSSRESKRYSRHSGTLSPGTALIVGFDVRLHSVLHYTANCACHHISTPISVETRAEKVTNEYEDLTVNQAWAQTWQLTLTHPAYLLLCKD